MNLISEFYRICNNRDIKGAIEFQKSLLPYFSSARSKGIFRTICAFDISYAKSTKTNYAAAVVMTIPELELIEKQTIIQNALFPYVPGLLAFREGTAIIDLYRNLRNKPDILLFDGQGIAHPRQMGIATMIGIMLDIQSVGCAKSRLIGEYEEPAAGRGSLAGLYHNNQKIGCVLRTRKGVKPVFVSAGNQIDLDTSVKVVLDCCRKYRLPEPVREAHKLANEIRYRDQAK
jgi:deoxyribonuclease V